MKIHTLEIRHFGQFGHRKFELPDAPLVVVYGENESGKSTLMHFMLYTLFGFPAKSELTKWIGSHEVSELGGALTFTGDDEMHYRLERTYGEKEHPRLFKGLSGSGDPDDLIHGVDRLLYRNVFCFDLDGLSGIEKMKPDDLNDFLLGAGMVGSRELSRLEQSLKRACGDLFKKGGRKPVINARVAQLEKQRAALKKWEEKLETYAKLQADIRRQEALLDALDQEKDRLRGLERERAGFEALRPALAGWRAVEQAIEKTGDLSFFPDHGRKQLESLNERIVALEADEAELDERLRHVDASIKSIRLNRDWIDEAGRLTALFRSAATDQQNASETRRLEEALNGVATECANVRRLLGTEWTEETIRQAATDLTFRHELAERLKRWRSFREREQEAGRAAAEREAAAGRLSDQMAVLRNERGDAWDSGNRRSQRSGASGLAFMSLSVLAAVLAASGLTALLFSPSSGLIVFISASLTAIVFLVRSAIDVRSRSGASVFFRSERDAAELAVLKRQLAEEKEKSGREAAARKQTAEALEREEQAFRQWLSANGYAGVAFESMDQVVQLIDRGQQLLLRMADIRRRMEELHRRHERFETERMQLARRLNAPDADIDDLEKRLVLEKEKERNIGELLKQRDIYCEQKQVLRKKRERFRLEKTRLLERSGCTSEEAFVALARKHEHLLELKKQREDRLMQLREAAGSEAVLQRRIKEMEDGKWEAADEQRFRQRLQEVEDKERAIREQLIRQRSEVRLMERNQSYLETLEQYQASLADLRRAAMEWSVRRTAARAIEKVKEQYREKKLPDVLARARRYFEKMTAGRYTSLHLSDTDGFLVARSDGNDVPAAALSRGTAEQLYLSLRLALADVIETGETLPLIVDDGLANFDRVRRRHVLSLLEQMSESRQVILFTCHRMDFIERHPSAVLTLNRDAHAEP